MPRDIFTIVIRLSMMLHTEFREDAGNAEQRLAGPITTQDSLDHPKGSYMRQHSIPKCIGSLNLWIQSISFLCEFLVLFFFQDLHTLI